MKLIVFSQHALDKLEILRKHKIFIDGKFIENAVGESIKNLDKITNKILLKKYVEFEWKRAIGMRDILTHHYFD